MSLPQSRNSYYTLIIQNLHQSATKEIVFLELKNREIKPDSITISKPKGPNVQAFVGFKAKDQRDDAFQKLQFTKILNKEITCAYYLEPKEQNLYKIQLKNIPKDADPKQIFYLWSQFGKIQSINIFLNSQGKPQGQGNIQLSSEEEVKNCLETYKQKIAEKPQLSQIEVEKYDKAAQKKHNGVMIRNINFDSKITSDIKSENIGAVAKEQSEKLQKAFQEKGIKVVNCSVFFSKEQTTKEQTTRALVTIEKNTDVQDIIDQYDQKSGTIFEILKACGINEDVKIDPLEDLYSDYAAIYIKNLAPAPEGKGEDYIENTLKSYISRFGEITTIIVKKGEKPTTTDRTFQDSYFSQIYLKRGIQGLEYIKNYQNIKEKEFKDLFNKSIPNATILLNKAARNQMKKNLVQHQKNESTLQQNAAIPQKQGFLAQPMAFPAAQYPPNLNNYNRRVQPHPPRHQQPKPYVNQNKPQAQPQQQQQQQQQPVAQTQQFQTIKQIQDNLQTFINLDKNKQFQYLGLLMFPKVKAELEKDQKIADPAGMAQKITGMMVDLTVFEVSEIIETLESQAEFQDRLQEAIELINQQSSN